MKRNCCMTQINVALWRKQKLRFKKKKWFFLLNRNHCIISEFIYLFTLTVIYVLLMRSVNKIYCTSLKTFLKCYLFHLVWWYSGTFQKFHHMFSLEIMTIKIHLPPPTWNYFFFTSLQQCQIWIKIGCKFVKIQSQRQCLLYGYC